MYGIFNEKISFGPLFSNYANLQKLFTSLIVIFGFLSKDTASPVNQVTIVDKILNINTENK